MVQIELTYNDMSFLEEHYPSLSFVEDSNIITGVLVFDLTYKGIRIKDNYHIEISLHLKDKSILPIVKETENKILKIVKRKGINKEDLHLNNQQGELCLIIPPKEKIRYPNGFELEEFLYHIEEHLYWVSYYERYEKPPLKDQAHGLGGYIQLYHEDHSYRPDVKKMIERLIKRPITRPEFRNFIKQQIKRKKL